MSTLDATSPPLSSAGSAGAGDQGVQPAAPHRSRRQGLLATPPALPDADFAEPDQAYGPHAFWFWNDPATLSDPGHYARMATAMAAQGLNPGYAHARFWAPDTPFWLTPDWHACMQAAVAATAATPAKLTWTMGDPCFPDKYILPDHPELRAASLRWSTTTLTGGATITLPESLFTVAGACDADGRLRSATLRILPAGGWQAPDGGSWTVWSFTTYHAVHPGGTAINVLDRRTAAPWLALEHGRYQDTIGGHFGATIDAVFFDHEGSYGYKLAWSDDLARSYRELTGGDIRLWMPLLLEEDAEGRWAKARRDWFDAVGRTYRACLFEPLDAWARERGMAVTCHLWEESLAAQALQTGGYMAAQRSYAMPGTDALFSEIFNPRLFRETQSVCEFEGRACMCEALGIAGWHATPTLLKRAANAGVAWGVTRFVPHGINARRDLASASYPPDFFDWNPYWRHLHRWTAFVRRASFVNDHGRLDAEVLLFCPLDSVCALLGDGIFDPARPHDSYLIEGRHFADASRHPEIAAIETAYGAAMQALHAARVEHLVADSHYLERMEVADGRLRLGGFAFSTLILPPLKLLPLASAARIAAFAAAGGRVVALGTLPDASAERGVGDPALAALMVRLRAAPGFTAASSLDGLDLPVAVAGADGLVVSRRRLGARLFLWLANNHDKARTCTLGIPGAHGLVERWDCDDGSVRALPSSDHPGGCRVALTIAPNDGFWLVVDPARPAAITAAPTAAGAPLRLNDTWQVSVDPADQPDPAQHRLAAPDWLLGAGAPRRLESWLAWDLRRFSGFVDYRQEVVLDDVRGDEVLDLGAVRHLAEVWVNGVHCGARLWAPYVFPLGAHLRPGANSLRIRVGNLILNAVTQYQDYPWKWHGPPGDDLLDAGLAGPVFFRPPALDFP